LSLLLNQLVPWIRFVLHGFVVRFLARERVTKESEKLQFIILHRFSNYPFLSSKKDPSLPSPHTDNSRGSTAASNTCGYSTSIGITDTDLNRAFVFLFYQRQYTYIQKWRSLFKLRHYTTHSTAFTNLTMQL